MSILAHETHSLPVTHRSCTPAPLQMADFHSILDVPELWKCLGSLWPGEVGQLKWRARCLLVSPRALQGHRLVLYQLKGQEEVDKCYYYDDHSSCASLLCSSEAFSLPSYYDPSDASGWLFATQHDFNAKAMTSTDVNHNYRMIFPLYHSCARLNRKRLFRMQLLLRCVNEPLFCKTTLDHHVRPDGQSRRPKHVRAANLLLHKLPLVPQSFRIIAWIQQLHHTTI